MPPAPTNCGRAGSAALIGRIRLIRAEAFGEECIPALARQIGVSERTWRDYEHGVTMPALALLAFLEATSAEPRWLLTGEGPRYRTGLDRA